MSTRCTTHFRDSGSDVAIVYRHGDGYPDGHGADLLRFLKECAELRDSRFNDPSYLAAKLVVWLANEFRAGGTTLLDFLSVGIVMSDPEDIEYMYTVDCGEGEWPVVKCFEVGGEEVPIPGNFTLGAIKRENRSILRPKPGRGHLYKKNCGDYRGNPMSWHMPESFYTISRFDIGRPTIRAFGRVWRTSGFIGRILPRDVGKRVYMLRDDVQVENDEQFNRRRAATGLTRFNDTPHRH